MKINTVRPQDNIFTNRLTNIVNTPHTLYYCGNLPSTPIEAVSIVGSRKPTGYGQTITETIIHTLAKYNITIVSGLALGIDSIAHRAALKFNTPTIAVMGRGLDKVYPASHHSLAKNIINAGGALISTYPEGVPAMPHHFLERNRIISGLSSAVIVTEAAMRSGTLNTAMHALEQGREVFAVPGNITSPMSAGCNRLIRQGARPLLHPGEILEALGLKKETKVLKPQKRKNPIEQTILEAILNNITDTNKIITSTKIEPNKIFSALSMLEISGIIKNTPEGDWIMIE